MNAHPTKEQFLFVRQCGCSLFFLLFHASSRSLFKPSVFWPKGPSHKCGSLDSSRWIRCWSRSSASHPWFILHSNAAGHLQVITIWSSSCCCFASLMALIKGIWSGLLEHSRPTSAIKGMSPVKYSGLIIISVSSGSSCLTLVAEPEVFFLNVCQKLCRTPVHRSTLGFANCSLTSCTPSSFIFQTLLGHESQLCWSRSWQLFNCLVSNWFQWTYSSTSLVNHDNFQCYCSFVSNEFSKFLWRHSPCTIMVWQLHVFNSCFNILLLTSNINNCKPKKIFALMCRIPNSNVESLWSLEPAHRAAKHPQYHTTSKYSSLNWSSTSIRIHACSSVSFSFHIHSKIMTFGIWVLSVEFMKLFSMCFFTKC